MNARSKVLTAVQLKIQVYWHVAGTVLLGEQFPTV
jgi:hypothetical protein